MRTFESSKAAPRRTLCSEGPGASRRNSDILACILYLSSALGLVLYYQFWIGQLYPVWTDTA